MKNIMKYLKMKKMKLTACIYGTGTRTSPFSLSETSSWKAYLRLLFRPTEN